MSVTTRTSVDHLRQLGCGRLRVESSLSSDRFALEFMLVDLLLVGVYSSNVGPLVATLKLRILVLPC